MCPRELASAPVKEGEILAGKYRVESVLGSGGMGVVVAATHLKLGTKVAVKFLLASDVDAPGAVDRFLREARAAARIESEHVARVADVATLDSGAPYIVMELLRGSDLAALVKKGPLPIEAAVEYVLQACEAIAEAHGIGIVHRDLKPSNLFLTHRPDGTPLVKVLDFGISKALDTARISLLPGGVTEPTSSFGSPLYMSPEQIRSSAGVDHRTDVWALGVVLHELVAGRPPFTRDELPALYLAIAQDPAPPLRSLRPETPEILEQVVLRCLRKDLDDRMPSVVALARALSPVAPASAQLSIDRIVRIAGAPSPFASTSEPPSAVDGNAPTKPVFGISASGPRTGNHGPWGSTAGRSAKGALPRRLLLAAAATVLLGAALWGVTGSRGPKAVTAESPPPAARPATPATPAIPATPATPAAPATPTTPATPAAPATPAIPATSGADAAASGTTAASRAPVTSAPAVAKPQPTPAARDTKRSAKPRDENGLDDRN